MNVTVLNEETKEQVIYEVLFDKNKLSEFLNILLQKCLYKVFSEFKLVLKGEDDVSAWEGFQNQISIAPQLKRFESITNVTALGLGKKTYLFRFNAIENVPCDLASKLSNFIVNSSSENFIELYNYINDKKPEYIKKKIEIYDYCINDLKQAKTGLDQENLDTITQLEKVKNYYQRIYDLNPTYDYIQDLEVAISKDLISLFKLRKIKTKIKYEDSKEELISKAYKFTN